MNHCLKCLLVGCISAVSYGSSQSVAGDYGGYPYSGLPWSYYTTEHVPYFALNPPVYYSRPVARPYGDSPFPWPAQRTEVQPMKPVAQTIINPFVPRTKPVESSAKTASRVLRIKNPFITASTSKVVDGTSRVIDESLARSAARRRSSTQTRPKTDPVLTDLLITWSILPEKTKLEIRDLLSGGRD